MACIISDNENDVVYAPGVGSFKKCNVNSRSRIRGYLPRSRYRPVSTIVQKGGRVRLTCWLRLGQSSRRSNTCYLTRSSSSVVSQTENCDRIGSSICIDFKRYRLSLTDTDVGGKPLNGGISRSTDVPIAGIAASFRVLAHNIIGPWGGAAKGLSLGRSCR